MSGLCAYLILFLLMTQSSPAWGRTITQDSLPRETYVPFTRQGNLILVKGSVNHKPITMIFDTGAAGCLFSRIGLKSLGVVPSKNLRAATVAGIGINQQTQAWMMPVDLSLGSIERRQFPVTINDNQLSFPLLGVNFLQGYEYTINTEANIIQFKLTGKTTPSTGLSQQSAPTKGKSQKRPHFIIGRPSFFDPDTLELISQLTSKPVITVDNACHYVYSVPFIEYKGAIIVMVNIDGKNCPMILDTGTNLCLFSNTHLKELGIYPHPTGRSLTARGVTGTIQAPICIFKSAQFGPITDELVCLVSDQAVLPRPLLGQNFYSKWRLTVDHDNHLIKFIHK